MAVENERYLIFILVVNLLQPHVMVGREDLDIFDFLPDEIYAEIEISPEAIKQLKDFLRDTFRQLTLSDKKDNEDLRRFQEQLKQQLREQLSPLVAETNGQHAIFSQWLPWGPWSTCDSKCVQSRTRHCLRLSADLCPGRSKERRKCIDEYNCVPSKAEVTEVVVDERENSPPAVYSQADGSKIVAEYRCAAPGNWNIAEPKYWVLPDGNQIYSDSQSERYQVHGSSLYMMTTKDFKVNEPVKCAVLDKRHKQHIVNAVLVIKSCERGNPCLHGGQCVLVESDPEAGSNNFLCKCPRSYRGTFCERSTTDDMKLAFFIGGALLLLAVILAIIFGLIARNHLARKAGETEADAPTQTDPSSMTDNQNSKREQHEDKQAAGESDKDKSLTTTKKGKSHDRFQPFGRKSPPVQKKSSGKKGTSSRGLKDMPDQGTRAKNKIYQRNMKETTSSQFDAYSPRNLNRDVFNDSGDSAQMEDKEQHHTHGSDVEAVQRPMFDRPSPNDASQFNTLVLGNDLPMKKQDQPVKRQQKLKLKSTPSFKRKTKEIIKQVPRSLPILSVNKKSQPQPVMSKGKTRLNVLRPVRETINELALHHSEKSKNEISDGAAGKLTPIKIQLQDVSEGVYGANSNLTDEHLTQLTETEKYNQTSSSEFQPASTCVEMGDNLDIQHIFAAPTNFKTVQTKSLAAKGELLFLTDGSNAVLNEDLKQTSVNCSRPSIPRVLTSRWNQKDGFDPICVICNDENLDDHILQSVNQNNKGCATQTDSNYGNMSTVNSNVITNEGNELEQTSSTGETSRDMQEREEANNNRVHDTDIAQAEHEAQSMTKKNACISTNGEESHKSLAEMVSVDCSWKTQPRQEHTRKCLQCGRYRGVCHNLDSTSNYCEANGLAYQAVHFPKLAETHLKNNHPSVNELSTSNNQVMTTTCPMAGIDASRGPCIKGLSLEVKKRKYTDECPDNVKNEKTSCMYLNDALQRKNTYTATKESLSLATSKSTEESKHGSINDESTQFSTIWKKEKIMQQRQKEHLYCHETECFQDERTPTNAIHTEAGHTIKDLRSVNSDGETSAHVNTAKFGHGQILRKEDFTKKPMNKNNDLPNVAHYTSYKKTKLNTVLPDSLKSVTLEVRTEDVLPPTFNNHM